MGEVSVNDPRGEVKAASILPEISEPSESTEGPISDNEAPYHSSGMSSAKKTEVEATMEEEENMII